MLYYASRISDNMWHTPERFLLCQNVPIARIGKQDYMASELPLPPTPGINPEDIITVYREPVDVFSKSAMASFEGKPVTNEHPSDMLNPQNVGGIVKGVAQNIRQSGDYLIADLLIYDALLITEIENGKREVSCGYRCQYEERGGNVCQVNIEGNHIAVVDSGRAGAIVSIRDSWPSSKSHGDLRPDRIQPVKTERSVKMSVKKVKNKGVAGALANLFPHFNKDSQPEDLAEIVEELVEAIGEEVEKKDEANPEKEPETVDKKDSGDLEKLCAILNTVCEKLDSVCTKVEDLEAARTADNDPLAKLEKELTEDSLDEEQVTTDPEAINEQTDGETAVIEVEKVLDGEFPGPVMPEADRPDNPLDSAVKDAALREIRKMKPIIAGIKDANQRKMMSDSMAKMVRATYGLPSAKKAAQGGGYGGIINARRTNAKTMQDRRKGIPNLDEIAQRLEKERLGKK